MPIEASITIKPFENPCLSNPCGSNAICAESNGQYDCVCQSGYIGNPFSGCRPECTINSECPSNKACINQLCKDPCPGTCGINAECTVSTHQPSCSCKKGFIGDPYSRCQLIPCKKSWIQAYLGLMVLPLLLTN